MGWKGEAALSAQSPGPRPRLSRPPAPNAPKDKGRGGNAKDPARAHIRPTTRSPCGSAHPDLPHPRRPFVAERPPPPAPPCCLRGPYVPCPPARGPLPAEREHEAAAGARQAGVSRGGGAALGLSRRWGCGAPAVPTYLWRWARRPAGG